MARSSQSNRFGRFELNAPPQRLVELRRRFPSIALWEQQIWDRSLAQRSVCLSAAFPFAEVKKRPARDFGFVAYLHRERKFLRIEPLFPDPAPRRGLLAMVMLPPEVARSGRFIKKGFDTVIIEHTHPEEFGFQNNFTRTYVRGPSDDDFSVLDRNPGAIGVIQALAPIEGRQFYY